MSNAAPSATRESRTSSRKAGRPGLRIALAVLAALLLVLLGYLAGVRSPWTAHHAHVMSGTAQRVAMDVPYAYFDPEGGDRVGFRLDDVPWSSGGKTQPGRIPPCLRDVGERVEVQVGIIEIARPYGSGSYSKVLSVTCPGG